MDATENSTVFRQVDMNSIRFHRKDGMEEAPPYFHWNT
jgi:hypothetical protein